MKQSTVALLALIIGILILLFFRYSICTKCEKGNLPKGGCCASKCNFFWFNKTRCFDIYGNEMSETEYMLNQGG